MSALPFDDAGESGTGRTLTVVLNRFAPRTPSGLVGGRNGAFGAEFEWTPNADRDVVGYRLYRVTGVAPSALDTVVCQTSVDDRLPTYCRDEVVPPLGTLHYYVVALAPVRSGTGLEESPRPTTLAQTLAVGTLNTPPSTPAELTATTDEDGVTLTWTASTDPDGIRYYRIYRDGVGYADRYDRTGSAGQLEYTDTDPGLGGHTYRVTAVDQKLAESAPTAAVTG